MEEKMHQLKKSRKQLSLLMQQLLLKIFQMHSNNTIHKKKASMFINIILTISLYDIRAMTQQWVNMALNFQGGRSKE
jgi:hypothetical protein